MANGYISASQAAEVGVLLDEGQHSHRAIAKLTGVSRGSVQAIAVGRRPRTQTPQPDRLEEFTADCGGTRCGTCVFCRARAARPSAA